MEVVDFFVGAKVVPSGDAPRAQGFESEEPNRSSILHLSEAGAAMEDGAESNPDAEGNPFGGRKMARNYR